MKEQPLTPDQIRQAGLHRDPGVVRVPAGCGGRMVGRPHRIKRATERPAGRHYITSGACPDCESDFEIALIPAGLMHSPSKGVFR